MSRIHLQKGSRICVLCAIVFFLAVTVLFNSCGKKGDPFPSRIGPPPPVGDLALDLSDDFLTLTWSVPKGKKKVVSSFAGFWVYRSKTPISDEECKGCPILFARIADVPIGDEAAGDPVTYTETIEKGFRYIYKVTLYYRTGAMSGDSNLVKIAY